MPWKAGISLNDCQLAFHGYAVIGSNSSPCYFLGFCAVQPSGTNWSRYPSPSSQTLTGKPCPPGEGEGDTCKVSLIFHCLLRLPNSWHATCTKTLHGVHREEFKAIYQLAQETSLLPKKPRYGNQILVEWRYLIVLIMMIAWPTIPKVA